MTLYRMVRRHYGYYGACCSQLWSTLPRKLTT